jgi:hypothetical protein
MHLHFRKLPRTYNEKAGQGAPFAPPEHFPIRSKFTSSAKNLFWLFCFIPLYNLIVYRQFPLPAQETLPLAGNLILLVWLVANGRRLLPHIVSVLRDPFVCWTSIFLCFQLTIDAANGFFEYSSYAPRIIMGLVVYATAAQVPSSLWGMFRPVIGWSVFFYLSFAALQLAGAGTAYEGRINSVFGNPNFFAFHLLQLLFFARLVVPNKPSLLWRWLMVIGVVISKTRSAILLLPVAMFSFSRRNMFRFVALSSILAACYVWAPQLLRLESKEEVMEMNARRSMWTQIADKFEFNLVWGRGTDAIIRDKIIPMWRDNTVVGYYQPQNHYLLVLAEGGIIGLILSMAGLIAYLRIVWPFRHDPACQTAIAMIFSLLAIQIAETDMFMPLLVPAIMGFGINRARELHP